MRHAAGARRPRHRRRGGGRAGVHLADTEGLDTLAELWSGPPADSLAGCLWRLYLLRSWVYADPLAAAREFDAGRRHTRCTRSSPASSTRPGRTRCGGWSTRCCAAWCAATSPTRSSGPRRSPGWSRPAGRRSARARRTPYDSDLSAARLLTMAEQLEHAGRAGARRPAGLTDFHRPAQRSRSAWPRRCSYWPECAGPWQPRVPK